MKPKIEYPDPIISEKTVNHPDTDVPPIHEKTVKHPEEQKPTKPGNPGEPEKDEDDPSLPKINVKTKNANDPDPDVPPIQEKTVKHAKEQLEPVQLAQVGKEDENNS